VFPGGVLSELAGRVLGLFLDFFLNLSFFSPENGDPNSGIFFPPDFFRNAVIRCADLGYATSK